MSKDETKVDLLSTREAGAYLGGYSERTLAKWRHLRVGPPWIKLSGRRVRYRPADLDAYVEARVNDPENEESAQ